MSFHAILIILSYHTTVLSWNSDASWIRSKILVPNIVDPLQKSFIEPVTSLNDYRTEASTIDHTNLNKRSERKFKVEGRSRRVISHKKLKDVTAINLTSWVTDTHRQSSLGDGYIHDERQEKSITSDAPAVLIESGPGTGKSLVLAARIAYLIHSDLCEPQNFIVLSFTKHDAKVLVRKAMNILDDHETYQDNAHANTTDIETRIWSGTVHSFAANILTKFDKSNNPKVKKGMKTSLHILTPSQMVARVQLCLGRMTLQDQKLLYKRAMIDCNQQITVLIQSIIRCIDLWKEAAIVSPLLLSRVHLDIDKYAYKDVQLKENCIELSLRIGIPMSVSLLSFDILHDYQGLHNTIGTMDTSDLSSVAYEFLQASPTTLFAIRSKLQHVIIDEYQDLSVSQHRLVSLLIKGVPTFDFAEKPKLLDNYTIPANRNIHLHTNDHVLFTTPKLFTAGDPNQSVYSWRGACPVTTVEGFRRDYPQGIIVPLNIHYRSPQSLLRTAKSLFSSSPSQSETKSDPVGFEISPAAIQSLVGLFNSSSSFLKEDAIKKFLGRESSSHITIKGLWDEREESKYVLSCIRRRWRERVDCVSHVVERIHHTDNNASKTAEPFYDRSEVAIMVRTSAQLVILIEELQRSNVPFTLDDPKPTIQMRSLLPMEPVKVMTMHRAKGDEFDDVYLIGWNEGVFPHPASVRSSRVEEERRLAYVAISRAKQICYITYSFMKRNRYLGPGGVSKRVTEQAAPSRFIDDLLHRDQYLSKTFDFNTDSFNFKEIIAGRNLPSYFSQSYNVPPGFKEKETFTRTKHDHRILYPDETTNLEKETFTRTKHDHRILYPDETTNLGPPSNAPGQGLLLKVEKGFTEIVSGKKGVCKEYSLIFRSMLKELGILRGTALVLNQTRNQQESVYALYNSKENERSKKALSKCTALNLCQYLAFILMKQEEVTRSATEN